LAPAATLTVPEVLSPPGKRSVPVRASTVPSLVASTESDELPVPPDFRRTPFASTWTSGLIVASPVMFQRPPDSIQIVGAGVPPRLISDGAWVTVPKTSSLRPFVSVTLPLTSSVAPGATLVVPGISIVPADHVEPFAPEPVRTSVPAPRSVPLVWVSFAILESSTVLVIPSVPPVTVRPPSSWRLATSMVPDRYVTLRPAGMQAVEPSTGTPWSQFPATSQNPSMLLVHVVVQGGVAGCVTPSGKSANTSGTAASSPDRRKSVALLTARNVAASSGFYKR
jgi:hypothetical protein